MAPTPLLATHVLKMAYTYAGLLHSVSPFVKAVVGTGASGYDLVSFYGGSVDTQTVVDDFAGDFDALLPSTVVAAGWTLYEYVGTVLNPIAVGSYTLTGVDTASFQGWGGTFVGKDEDLKPCKFYVPEGGGNTLNHWSSASVVPTGVVKTFAEALIDTAPENWGGFFRNRNDKAMKVSRGITIAPNRKIRRKRGLT